ncbi:MAG: tRNA pseudouridine(38-40) synthase TruA [Bryobacteraceae bacterium]|jgi:tRNA pseudouridine38-40 synthase
MRRIQITLAYDGTDYHGWQVQPALPTIQGTLQDVLAEIEGQPVHVDGSGRTDAGVHALAQVAAFSLSNPIPLENLKRAMNRLLPGAIRVFAAEETDTAFNPRYDARAKTYEYRIFRGEVCPPFERRYVYHYPYPLDLVRLLGAAPLFEGQHDFSAFAAADDRDREGGSKVRTIFSSRAEIAGDRLLYRVRGSGFLKHMVRNLVGTLLEIGKGNLAADSFQALKAGRTAPAHGLFLLRVEY